MGDSKQHLKVRFARDENVVPMPVTGAYGGPTADGNSLFAIFFVEHADVGALIDVEIDESGNVSESLQARLADVVREVVCKLVFSPEAAVAIGTWLKERGEQLIEAKKERVK